jgi:putative transposase
MKDIYKIAKITKQGFNKSKNNSKNKKYDEAELVIKVNKIREKHPKMGLRKIYKKLDLKTIGRDKFEKLMILKGFRVKKPRNYKRTTYSLKNYHYKNIIKGLEINDINRVWSTDITYIQVNSTFYYLNFLVDLYSRRLVGYSANETLMAEGTIKSLKKTIKERNIKSNANIIHHSDKGSQYVDKKYQNILKKLNFKISMCNEAYDNAYSERVNGIIKNEYLNNWVIKDFKDLERKLEKAVYLYNNERPHLNLVNGLTPVAFERYIETIDISKRPQLKLLTNTKSLKN